MNHPASSRAPLLILAFSFIAVAALCVPEASKAALWIDELYTVHTAELAPGELLRRLFNYERYYYDHPPLYFQIARAVLFISDSPLALRAPSILFTALALAIWGIELWRRGASLPAACALVLLLAAHPLLRIQATSARMYPLLLLASSAATCLILRAFDRQAIISRARIIILALAIAAALYTSYFAALFVASAFVFVTIGPGLETKNSTDIPSPDARRAPRTKALGLLAALTLGVILFLPWAPAVIRMLAAERSSAPVVGAPTPPSPWIAVYELHGSGAIPVAILALGLLGLIFAPPERRRPALALLVCMAWLPLFALIAFTPAERAVLSRYLIHAIPVLFFVAALGWRSLVERVWTCPVRRAVYASIPLLVPIPFMILHLRAREFAPRPDWWAAAEIIERNARPEEFILTGGHLSGEALVYHLDHPENFSFLHYITHIDPFYLNAKATSVIWYVNASPLPPGHRAIIQRYFPYRVTFPGNRGLYPPAGEIEIASKKPFKLPSGARAPYHEPVPLPYESPAGESVKHESVN